MKPVHVHCTILLGIILPLGIGGCHVNFVPWSRQQAKFTRTWTGQTPKDALTALSVRTTSGGITVTGADVNAFDVTAEIAVNAPSEEQAEEFAGRVEIVCKPNGDTLEIEARHPELSFNGGVSVNYTIVAPRRTNVKCNSSYGKLSFADLDGTLAGKTSSGSVEARNIKGSIDLESSYGAVTCTDATGPGVVLKTSSGNVHATNITGSLRASSSYGAVTCKGFSKGDLVLKSSSGRVEVSDADFGTCEAQSTYGAVSAERATGSALKLHSGSGAISATNTRADQMSLSTSYGSVTARNVTTAGLTAESASGSVDCELTPDSAPTLTANVSSSYGSVSLLVPPAFAGQVDLSTDYGSIHTEKPVTTSGEISKKQLTGSIGTGTGRLRLHTSSGSVSLK
jgi:DUF4097 and DUF4098 domain-containing protein YvlB